MNAFSRAFEAHIQHGIEAAKWPSRTQFAERAGTSASNITGITKYGLFPKVETLGAWLERTGATEQERHDLMTLCSTVKSEKSAETTKHLAALNERIESSLTVIAALVALCEDAGMDIPDEIKERIRSL